MANILRMCCICGIRMSGIRFLHALSSFLNVPKLEVTCHLTELWFTFNFTGEQ